MLKKSGDTLFVNILIKNISKFVRKDLFCGPAGVSFTLELVEKAALDAPNPKIFSNLNRYLDLSQNERQRAQIFLTQLNCYKYRKNVGGWLEYMNYLWKHDKSKVKSEYQRALLALDSDQSQTTFSKSVSAFK